MDNYAISEAIAAAELANAQAAADIADAQRTQECYVCNDECDLSRVLQIDCGAHWLCHDCIPSVFEMAINNEANYPPRCCDLLEALFIEDFVHLIKDAELVKRYEAKTEEYRTHVMFRRYCAANGCRKTFLPITTYEEVADGDVTIAQCPTCANVTCIGCLLVVSGTDYRHECLPYLPRLEIEYDRSNGRMKACPYCGEGVELSDGCNHMTCRCGNQWCFECLLPWASQEDHYECQQYNEPEYDDEGYSKTRSLHRDTGLDRQGFNGRGVNIRGLDRYGNRVPEFAYLDKNRFVDGAANRPQGLLDMDEEDFREAAMLQLLQEIENGLVLQTDDLEHEIERRFGVIQQQNFNINHHNGHHHHNHDAQDWGDGNNDDGDNDGGWDNGEDDGHWENDDIDEFDDADIFVEDEDDERQFENDGYGWGLRGVRRRRMVQDGVSAQLDMNGFWFALDPEHEQDDLEEVERRRQMVQDGIRAQLDMNGFWFYVDPDHEQEEALEEEDDHQDQFQPGAGWGEGWGGDQQAVDDGWGGMQQEAEVQGDANLANMIEQANWLEDPAEADDQQVIGQNVNALNEVRAEGDEESELERDPPTQHSMTCQHNWDVVEDDPTMCEACGQFPDPDNNIVFLCSICHTWACIECYSNFAQMALIYFPEMAVAENAAAVEDATAVG